MKTNQLLALGFSTFLLSAAAPALADLAPIPLPQTGGATATGGATGTATGGATATATGGATATATGGATSQAGQASTTTLAAGSGPTTSDNSDDGGCSVAMVRNTSAAAAGLIFIALALGMNRLRRYGMR